MNMSFFKSALLLLAMCVININVASCGKNDPENNPEERDEILSLQGVTRGYRQDPILDMVLIYQGGTQRVEWTPEETYPYVVHTKQNNQKDWFFDGFLFLEFQDGQGVNFVTGNAANREARKQEWEWLANRHFADGKAIKALNTCIEDAKKEIGEPNFRHKIVIGLTEPFLNQKDWGEINGVTLDFSKREDRIAASIWYVDLLLQKFEESNLNNLDLEGFYWVHEHLATNDFITREIGDYIRQKGKRFYWIPYWMANGFSQWKENGFDIAYLQPNYFFATRVGDKDIEADRIRHACELAHTHNLAMEMEFNNRALADSPEKLRYKFLEYINTFREQGVFQNSSIAYYEGGRGVYNFSRSTNPLDKELMDMLQSILKERRERMSKKVIYHQDFKAENSIDASVWRAWNSDNVKLTRNGLEISSGGTITRFNTFGKFDFMYGRVEVKARILTDAKNTRIRLRLLPTVEKLGIWPASGELMMMVYDGENPTKIRVGPNTEKMNENIGNIRDATLDWGGQFLQTHTFVCDWEEKMITFYVDGMKAYVTEDLFGKQYSDYPNYWPFNEKFYLEISVMSDTKEPAICIETIKISQ